MSYLVGIFRTLSLGDNISSDPERTAPKRWWEEPDYIEVLPQRTGSLNITRLLLIEENQISQVKEFSAFLCMGRCKSPGSLKPFLSYVSQLSGFSILCFSHPEFLSADHREQLQPGACQTTGTLLLPGHTWGSEIHIWRARISMTVTSSFTDTAGDTPFLSFLHSLFCFC